ncbi:EamA family transporter [Aurantiacibacter spongiae]|uniref:EamA family transporter n=1 Tax=Aurantiacibacter spongiae TaxID=2488860 RepID=A0A3N5CRT9_9SPHN|nr:EamA family transporter [Aurantiacibacter spongiae]RPF71814.1 EamA family transporter [Aurantiacibacter spongiae]
MPERTDLPLAVSAMLLAQLSINGGAALGKSLFPLVGPEGVAALRTGIAGLILLGLARPWRAWPSVGQMRWLVPYGLALGGMNLLIYWAFARIPIGIAVAIEITGPLSVVLAMSRNGRDLLWFALAATGVALLVPWPGRSSALDPLGVAFALGAAACWACYILFGKRAAQVPSLTAVSVGMMFGCLLTVPLGVAEEGARLLDPDILMLGLTVALLSSALPYALEMRALAGLDSRLFGTISSAAPATAVLAGWVFLGEALRPVSILGIGCVIAACAGASLTSGAPLARPRENLAS